MSEADAQVREHGPREHATRPRLLVRRAKKSFSGRNVVDIDELVLGEHPIEGLIGPNGAGKTTLMRLVMGSVRLDSGDVRLAAPGRPEVQLSGLPAHKIARMGLVKTNQIITDFAQLTILDSLLLSVTPSWRERPYRLGGERANYEAHREEIHHYLAHFGVRDPNRLALSAGEKKVVDIVRCLLLKPSVLLLDEPTAGLPGEMTDKVMGAVTDLAAAGTAVVIIEHDLDVIWGLCSQVTFMAEGRVLLQGEPSEIRQHRTVVESYLGQGHV